MARLTARRKNFGMAKAVKKSPNNNGKSRPQQSKNSPSNRRQTTAKQNQMTNSIPKRSTRSILKRELAQTINNAANGRSSPKNAGSGRKTTSKANESATSSKSNSPGKILCDQANVKTDKLRKVKVEQQKMFVQSNSSGDTSPSIFDETMLIALEYPQKSDSTVLSSDLLANAFNDVVINSADRCPKSPDLFETESMEGDEACIDSMKHEQNDKIKKVEMVSASVQCKLPLQNHADAQVGTDDHRVKMIDVSVQTSPLPCASCQTNDDDGFANFEPIEEFSESDGSYGSYESDSSYDHCLDDFDCLEHLDDDGSPYRNTTEYYGNGRDRSKMDAAEPVIDESPPRNQVYKNRGFHSPESLELNTTKKHR